MGILSIWGGACSGRANVHRRPSFTATIGIETMIFRPPWSPAEDSRPFPWLPRTRTRHNRPNNSPSLDAADYRRPAACCAARCSPAQRSSPVCSGGGRRQIGNCWTGSRNSTDRWGSRQSVRTPCMDLYEGSAALMRQSRLNRSFRSTSLRRRVWEMTNWNSSVELKDSVICRSRGPRSPIAASRRWVAGRD